MNTPKELSFITFRPTDGQNINPAWLKGEILKVNNLLTIPCKIIEFKTKKTDTGSTAHSILVEECLDEKEWNTLREAWQSGWAAAHNTDSSKFIKEKI